MRKVVAERIARELAEAGVRRIRVHNLSYADPSVVLRDVFRYDTLVVGSPAFLKVVFVFYTKKFCVLCAKQQHSQFEKIPISAERKERMLNEQILFDRLLTD